jgi:hypothetical protein
VVESGTIDQALPGLEAPSARESMKVGHALPLTPQKRLMMVAGRSHGELAQRMAEQLGLELGEVELGTFANGESHCRYLENIRGTDLFIVQTGCEPVDRTRTLARIGRRSRASRSPPGSWPTCSSWRGPTGC